VYGTVTTPHRFFAEWKGHVAALGERA